MPTRDLFLSCPSRPSLFSESHDGDVGMKGTRGMTTVSLTHDDEMLGLAQRLIGDYDGLPAGAVLRALARATRDARLWGCPPEHLLATVEASTRWRLEQRVNAA
jgi:hypothetical protein